jgi:hypothetical protein
MDGARNRELSVYCERHHIKPRSLGGSDKKSNVVLLTYREHFLAHWLLTKIFKGLALRKMQHAFFRMSQKTSRGDGRGIAGWQYAVARRAKAASMIGNKGWAKNYQNTKGRKLSADHREKLTGPNPKISSALKGRTLSEEHRANLSAAAKGRKLSPETRAKMSASHKGCKPTLETRIKLSAAQKGHPYYGGHP